MAKNSAAFGERSGSPLPHFSYAYSPISYSYDASSLYSTSSNPSSPSSSITPLSYLSVSEPPPPWIGSQSTSYPPQEMLSSRSAFSSGPSIFSPEVVVPSCPFSLSSSSSASLTLGHHSLASCCSLASCRSSASKRYASDKQTVVLQLLGSSCSHHMYNQIMSSKLLIFLFTWFSINTFFFYNSISFNVTSFIKLDTNISN